MHKFTSYLLFSLVISIILHGCSDEEFHGTEITPDLPTTSFNLIDQFGQPFSLEDNQGQIVVAFFGFTYCPDICPATLSKWSQVEKALGDQAQNVKFVYITVDPERDTPETLRDHLETYSPNFIGLTGDTTALKDVYDGYGIIREKVKISESAAGYLVNHTARFYIFDKTGRWRLTNRNDTTAEEMTHDIKILLKEKIES